jgi:hypothetical protein
VAGRFSRACPPREGRSSGPGSEWESFLAMSGQAGASGRRRRRRRRGREQASRRGLGGSGGVAVTGPHHRPNALCTMAFPSGRRAARSPGRTRRGLLLGLLTLGCVTCYPADGVWESAAELKEGLRAFTDGGPCTSAQCLNALSRSTWGPLAGGHSRGGAF